MQDKSNDQFVLTPFNDAKHKKLILRLYQGGQLLAKKEVPHNPKHSFEERKVKALNEMREQIKVNQT